LQIGITGQLAEPSLSAVVLGPIAFMTFPVLMITPDCMGKLGLVFWKNPIPLEEPKLVPVRDVTFCAETQGELIRTALTSWGTVYVFVLTEMAWV
jgi:hypothetical protein